MIATQSAPRHGITALLLLAPLLFCATALAVRDDVNIQGEDNLRGVVVIAENYDGVTVDTNADGTVDRTLPAAKVTAIRYGDTPPEYRRADTYMRAARYEQAVEAYQEALKSNARDFWIQPDAHAAIGRAYLAMARVDDTHYDKAVEHFRQVIENHPKSARVPDAMRGLAQAQLARGRTDEAKKLLDDLASGTYGQQYVLLATVDLAGLNARQGNPQQAVALCDKALAMADKPEYERVALEAKLGCADALTRSGKGDRAYDILSRMVGNYDERETDIRARLFNAMGDSLLEQDKVKEALMAYLRVRVLYFRAEDELPRALYGTALCFRARKEGARANEVVRELLEDHTDTKWAELARKEFPGVKPAE